jgi:2-keto-4-pentenoate hydratase/2-oxohepta-3-ene-1,7-dioic acid hydratase in catechol pathway
MKLIRFQIEHRTPRFGWVHEDEVGVIEGNPFADFRRREADIQLRDIRLLPPVIPGKIICIGRNYTPHASEQGVDVPDMPLLFLKPPSSVIGSDAPIVIPPQSSQVEHEAELAVVISKTGRWIDLTDTLDYVMGYTIANDVTARDLQRRDGQWTRGKGFDTFCPLGPWIETEFDPADRLIQCHVNGELRQMASTGDMIFPIRQLIAFTSSVMTIEPGDILLTGTPSGVGLLAPGDVVEVTIDGLGKLRNPVESDYHS